MKTLLKLVSLLSLVLGATSLLANPNANPNPMTPGTSELGVVVSRISGLSYAYNFEKARIATQLSKADDLFDYAVLDLVTFSGTFYYGLGIAGILDKRERSRYTFESGRLKKKELPKEDVHLLRLPVGISTVIESTHLFGELVGISPIKGKRVGPFEAAVGIRYGF